MLTFDLCQVGTITYNSHGIKITFILFYETVNEDENCIGKEPSKSWKLKSQVADIEFQDLGFAQQDFSLALV